MTQELMEDLDLDALADQAAELEDQSLETTGGDFEYTPPPAGRTFGRLIEYIEEGEQPQGDYNGKPKKPEQQIRITFELLHPKNIKEVTTKDGETILITDKITLTLTKKLNNKARFKNLFNKLTYGRDIKHIGKMLGDAFLFDIVHNEGKGKNAGKIYANIYNPETKEFFIYPPFNVDHMSGEKVPLNIPERISPLRAFFQQVPTKATWDSLFIDGSREIKNADGTLENRSKNYLQEKLLKATDFDGSPLHQMLLGAGTLPDLATLGDDEHEEEGVASLDEAEEAPPVEETPPAKKPEATTAKPVTSAAPASTTTASAKTATTTSLGKGAVTKAVGSTPAATKAVAGTTPAAAPKQSAKDANAAALAAMGLDS